MSSKENYFSTKKYEGVNYVYFFGFKLYCFTFSQICTVTFYASKFQEEQMGRFT